MGETSFPSSLRIQMRPPAPSDFAVSTAVSRSFRESVLPLEGNALYGPSGFGHFLEHAELRGPKQGRQLFHGQLEPEVGLVRSRSAPWPRVIVHSLEWAGKRRFLYRFVKDRHDAFAHRYDIVHVDEAHLQVELGEFRLPVRPQVLVPEAAGYLEVLVEARPPSVSA